MTTEPAWIRIELAALTALILGAIVCVYAAATAPAAFYRAWLCAYVFWLGVPLGALTLVLVHDLTGDLESVTSRDGGLESLHQCVESWIGVTSPRIALTVQSSRPEGSRRVDVRAGDVSRNPQE